MHRPAPSAPPATPGPPDRDDAVRLLARHPLVRGLDAAIVEALADGALPRRVKAGTMLFHDGDAAHHWLLIADGEVEMVRFTFDGTERVFHVFGPGQTVAEAAMFMPHRRYPMNARARTGATVWRFSGAALRQACERHAPLAMRLLETFGQRLYQRTNQVDWLATSSPPERLAAWLMARFDRIDGDAIELPMTQRQLAAHLGVRPETLSRLFARWRDEGRVAGAGRRWQVLDADALRALASGSMRPF